MEMRRGRAARAADATNCLPSSDRIARLDGCRRQMGVACLDPFGCSTTTINPYAPRSPANVTLPGAAVGTSVRRRRGGRRRCGTCGRPWNGSLRQPNADDVSASSGITRSWVSSRSWLPRTALAPACGERAGLGVRGLLVTGWPGVQVDRLRRRLERLRLRLDAFQRRGVRLALVSPSPSAARSPC